MTRLWLCAAAVLAQNAAASPAPKRAWAHSEGVVRLERNGVHLARDSALDRQLVTEAINRWGIAYDEGRFDVIESLFTRDARFIVLNGSARPVASAVGRDAILRTARSSIEQQGDQRRHLVTNVVIDRMSASAASLIAYALVAVPGDTNSIGATVIYTADLRRESDGVWRFTRLVIGMDSYAGQPPRIPEASLTPRQ